MQRQFLGIMSVDFDVRCQLLIIYSAFVKHVKGIYNEAVHQVFSDFKKAYDSLTRMVLF